MVDVFSQSVGFFDDPNRPVNAIMPKQVSISDPALPTLSNATGMISPDQATKSRLVHFDENLYDLRDQSHLVRLMQALLGDAGAGQLRKRYSIARLQATLSGTNFYDLDGFYGALFSAQRKVDEQLPFDPMSGAATPDQWDDIATRDAKYRERIYALARSLPMAGTVTGLQQAAEALTGVDCDVYETWRLIDSGSILFAGRTFDEVETAFETWQSFEDTSETWASVSGAVEIGRSGVGNRDEVIIRPKMTYNSEHQRQEDEMNIQRVLNILKPAGVLLTVDNRGVVLHVPTKICALEADSNYWEIITKVKPKPSLSTVVNPYPLSPIKVSVGSVEGGVLAPLPKPPFTNSQGYQWSYNSAITSVNGLSIKETTAAVSGSGTVIDPKNWEKVTSHGGGGSTIYTITSATHLVEYFPAMGISDQAALLAAQASADSVLMAHPYSGPRVVVPTSG
jgi:hypothetical protein